MIEYIRIDEFTHGIFLHILERHEKVCEVKYYQEKELVEFLSYLVVGFNDRFYGWILTDSLYDEMKDFIKKEFLEYENDRRFHEDKRQM